MPGAKHTIEGKELVEINDPLCISRHEVLELFDRVLRRERPISDAYLFAIDVDESSMDGTARLEDPSMLPVLQELAHMTAVTHAILEEIRRRLRRPHEEGTA